MPLILIVEDNEKNLKLLRDVLRFKGYETVEAMTGAEGVRLARECNPDLVLMDIQLPDIDGVTALAQIRANAATRDMPVIAVSASVMPDEQQRIAASGFNAYVTKPISVKSFVETVEKFAGKPGG
ncbi:MAG: two-component system, cell cycle response regulator DivK [Betaproteobacteria bacterium]|jgi:two-component system cell cycle response regulator DivK